MKMPEQNLWTRISGHMRTFVVRLERHEDILGSGLPDVEALSYGSVTWLELKARREWPARDSSMVLGDDGLNQDQKNWHLSWRDHGGRVATLIGVGSYEYVLVDGYFSDRINEMNRVDLLGCATLSFDSRKDRACWSKLYDYLRND